MATLSFKQSLFTKLVLIGLLIVALLIPLTMIDSLVYERKARYNSVIDEVSRLWGYPQTITGPIITIPYRVLVQDQEGKMQTHIHKLQYLPDELGVKAEIVPEKRWRGIFEVVVYTVKLTVSGRFPPLEIAGQQIPNDSVSWEESFLSLGISDTRGIRDNLLLQWDDSKVEFLSGAGNNGLFEDGLHVRLSNFKSKMAHTFQLEVSLNGNDQLLFVPVGKKTVVDLHSTWMNPSFIGAFLPTEREINAGGFSAKWEISHLGRNYPQVWTTRDNPTINFYGNQPYKGNYRTASYDSNANAGTTFGVRLLLPVDFYQKTQRAIKYGILFILLTFTIFFLFETFNPLRIHPLQYLMVGCALCLFFLLLLSFSEHLGFSTAYLFAATSTIFLISMYSMKILASKRRGAVMGLTLAGLYIYLYTLLHLQDYALLFGSIGLFLILATVMYVTRNIDWYSSKQN